MRLNPWIHDKLHIFLNEIRSPLKAHLQIWVDQKTKPLENLVLRPDGVGELKVYS